MARAAADDWDARDELERIARADPAVLRPQLRDLLDRDLLWPTLLFAGADEETEREVIARIDAGGGNLNHLLLILSLSRSAAAAAAFRRWQAAPPPGMDTLHVDALDYARAGGWELRPDGTEHELCGPVAHELVLSDGTGDDGVCPWCRSPLWALLEVDTADPAVAAALAHTGWSGRLRVTTCAFCSNYTTLYTDVTPDGGAVWSAHNERPGDLEVSVEEPPAVTAGIGPVRPSRWLASAWDAGGSTLGGVPDWIQDDAYPPCPVCGLTMDYVGLVGGADLDWGEGAEYVYLHAGCGVAAVNYQQS